MAKWRSANLYNVFHELASVPSDIMLLLQRLNVLWNAMNSHFRAKFPSEWCYIQSLVRSHLLCIYTKLSSVILKLICLENVILSFSTHKSKMFVSRKISGSSTAIACWSVLTLKGLNFQAEKSKNLKLFSPPTWLSPYVLVAKVRRKSIDTLWPLK